MYPKIAHGKDYADLPPEEFDQWKDCIPTDVYHYTTQETALVKILKNRTIRLSRLINTNDPKESKVRLYHDSKWVTNNGILILPGGVQEEKIMTEWKVICLSCNKQPNRSFMRLDDRRAHPINDYSMFGLAYSSMWAHYAERHKGICLLFNGTELNKSINDALSDGKYTIRCGFVKYDDGKSSSPIKVDDLDLDNNEDNERLRRAVIMNYRDNFLCKSTQWKPEHEFRWLVHNRDLSELELFIPIEKAIKAVIIGEDFPDVFNVAVKNLCSPLGIEIFKIFWTNGLPSVNTID